MGAFGRALHWIYRVDEGRPLWKLRPLQILLTPVAIMAGLVLLGLVVSGPVAPTVGETIGLGSSAVTDWNLANWPVILAVVVLLVAMLYYATPNVRQPAFPWVSVGAGSIKRERQDDARVAEGNRLREESEAARHHRALGLDPTRHECGFAVCANLDLVGRHPLWHTCQVAGCGTPPPRPLEESPVRHCT